VIVDLTLQRIEEEMKRDVIMGMLTKLIIEGFPDHKERLDMSLHEYWKIRDKLSVVDDTILYGCERVVIPKALRKEILQELHAAHQRVERALARARQCVYWPGLENDVRNVIGTCKECALYGQSQQKEPLIQDEPPTRPGEAIAMDLFHHSGKEYLVITDKFSGWPDIYEFRGNNGVSTEQVTKAILQWAKTLGVPNRITSDNGPQFKSNEFREFCGKWGICHDPSSPYHHIANGYAEAAVKSMKALVKKICPGKSISTSAFFHAMLEYRNTPRKDGLSPAQRIFGRPTRTRLPLHPVTFHRSIQDLIRKADRKAVQLRSEIKKKYDITAKTLSILEVGDIVRVQHQTTKKWDLIAKIMEIKPRKRSYLLKSETGRLYWRNRRFIRKTA
jgi:transposase InsO family protein